MSIIDDSGLIRVGGRLQHSSLCYDAQHHIILPKNRTFPVSLVMHFHRKQLHAGHHCLLASIRQQYWPIGGHIYIYSFIIFKCLTCVMMKPKLHQHVMDSLPSDRVTPSRAFHASGIDFCGPFYYKSDIKCRPPMECYVCIFICFSSKATHLKVVQKLSMIDFYANQKAFGQKMQQISLMQKMSWQNSNKCLSAKFTRMQFNSSASMVASSGISYHQCLLILVNYGTLQ